MTLESEIENIRKSYIGQVRMLKRSEDAEGNSIAEHRDNAEKIALDLLKSKLEKCRERKQAVSAQAFETVIAEIEAR